MPKQKPGELRVIQYLSFPEGLSINDVIQKEFSAVTYQTVGDVVKLIERSGKGALFVKKKKLTLSMDIKHPHPS